MRALVWFCLVFGIPAVNAVDGLTSYVGLVHPTGARLQSKDATRFPERVTMTLSLANDRPLRLVKTENLFAPTYRAERRGLNDSLHSTVHAGPPTENCWYHAEAPEEMAAISLCNGVQGLWWIGNYADKKHRVLWVEPQRSQQGSPIKIQDVHSQVHRVFDVTDDDLDRDLRCGTTDMGLFGRELELHRRALQHVDLQSTSARQVRVLLINDYARYRREGSQIESTTISLFNAVQEVYRKAALIPHLTLSLAGQLTFVDADPYTAATRSGEVLVFGSTGLLDQWNDYRTKMSARLPVHDHGQLLSGQNFESRISGLAGVGTLCEPTISGSITQLTYGQLSNVVIMAHELGHGLGMSHDGRGNTCPTSGYIMQPTIGSSLSFSTCSLSACSGFVQRSGQYCLPLAPAAVEEGADGIRPAIESKVEAAKETAKGWLASRAREHIGAIVGTTLGIPLGTYLLWRIVKGKGLPKLIPSFSWRKFFKRAAATAESAKEAQDSAKSRGKDRVKGSKYEAGDLHKATDDAPGSHEFETQHMTGHTELEQPPFSSTTRVTRSAAQQQNQPPKFTDLPSTPPTSSRSSYARVASSASPGSAAAGGRPMASIASRRAKEALEDEDEDLQVWEGDDIPASTTKPVQTSEPRTTATKWLDER